MAITSTPSPRKLRKLRELRELRERRERVYGNVRFEVLPLPGIEEQILAEVPYEVKITVTASPRRGQEETFALAERLVPYGYRVVPHLSARLVRDRVHLKDLLERMAGLGITEVFVIAGDQDRPVGSYADSVELLAAMADLGHGLDEVGVAGYPERHPKIPDDVTIQAMWDKQRFATYVVSQICFDPATLARWIDRLRARGVGLPIYVGVPGPASVTKLLRVSRRIGVGDSLRFLTNHGAGLLRLAGPGHYAPDRLLDRLAGLAGDQISGLHLYTFNDVSSTERWRREALGEETEETEEAGQQREGP